MMIIPSVNVLMIGMITMKMLFLIGFVVACQTVVYRSAFAEDKEELKEKVPEGGFRELRLRRLV